MNDIERVKESFRKFKKILDNPESQMDMTIGWSEGSDRWNYSFCPGLTLLILSMLAIPEPSDADFEAMLERLDR